MKRTLGNKQVSAMGLGCWAIGGPFWDGEKPVGWGEVDDNESIRAIHAGIEAGVNFFDTADVYGAGHSEKVLGKALAGKRDNVVIATKFGVMFDESTKQITGVSAESDYIESAVEASLKRLGTDDIDVLWFHLNDFETEKAGAVADTLEGLVSQGKILSYGWSTDFPDRAEVFDTFPNCIGYEYDFNVLTPNPMFEFCESRKKAGVIRGPLAMGLLSGKYDGQNVLSESDVRKITPDWMRYFKDGVAAPELMERFNAIRDILTSKGRTPVQGALAWLWGKGETTIPIPGFRTVDQVKDLAGAMEFGALTQDQMDEIETLLDR